jgi:hypothetical protein
MVVVGKLSFNRNILEAASRGRVLWILCDG